MRKALLLPAQGLCQPRLVTAKQAVHCQYAEAGSLCHPWVTGRRVVVVGVGWGGEGGGRERLAGARSARYG